MAASKEDPGQPEAEAGRVEVGEAGEGEREGGEAGEDGACSDPELEDLLNCESNS